MGTVLPSSWSILKHLHWLSKSKAMEGRNAEVLAVRTSAVQATLLGPTKPLGQSANRLSWTMGHDGTICLSFLISRACPLMLRSGWTFALRYRSSNISTGRLAFDGGSGHVGRGMVPFSPLSSIVDLTNTIPLTQDWSNTCAKAPLDEYMDLDFWFYVACPTWPEVEVVSSDQYVINCHNMSSHLQWASLDDLDVQHVWHVAQETRHNIFIFTLGICCCEVAQSLPPARGIWNWFWPLWCDATLIGTLLLTASWSPDGISWGSSFWSGCYVAWDELLIDSGPMELGLFKEVESD